MNEQHECDFPDPLSAPDDLDLVALSARTLSGHNVYSRDETEWPKLTQYGSTWDAEVLLDAYRRGLFPMPFAFDDDEGIGWWSPESRAIFWPEQIKISRSLRKSLRHFTVRVDTCFRQVVEACADPKRPQGWINERVVEAFEMLHLRGVAHSIEVFDATGTLAGGLYGVEIGGVFAGESMFHVQPDASKVALVHLAQMFAGQGRIIDTQWQTDHLASLGALEVTREEYLQLLSERLDMPSASWTPLNVMQK